MNYDFLVRNFAHFSRVHQALVSISLTILTEDPHTKLLKFESLQIVQMSSDVISRRNNQNEIAIENDKTISKTCVLKKYEVRTNATALCMQAKQTLVYI